MCQPFPHIKVEYEGGGRREREKRGAMGPPTPTPLFSFHLFFPREEERWCCHRISTWTHFHPALVLQMFEKHLLHTILINSTQNAKKLFSHGKILGKKNEMKTFRTHPKSKLFLLQIFRCDTHSFPICLFCYPQTHSKSPNFLTHFYPPHNAAQEKTRRIFTGH